MTTLTRPPLAALRDMVDERTLLMPFTVEQYHWMIEAGYVPEGEPYELLNGCLLRKDRSATGADPMTVGRGHVLVVNKLARLSRKVERLGCFLQTQQPISLPPYDEPEPDGSIVRGKVEDYAGRLPGAADVLCAIEVADSSLRRDRTTKLQVYAAAGIGRYILINLPDRVVEVYTQPLAGKGGPPRYGRVVTLSGRDAVELPVARGNPLSLPARGLLP